MQKETSHMKKALLMLVPVIVLLSGCGQQVSLEGQETELASRTASEGARTVVFPDDNPSVPDGKGVWEKMSCAECHSATGEPVSGKATVNLADAKYMAKQKPVVQYEFIAYGKEGSSHPVMRDKMSRRELWDLVFYVRSLAIPPLSDKDIEQIDALFGSNCVVCHGTRGHGDGPLAHNMEPLPANFHQYNRFYDREDDLLWDHIANGINWAGMPNFLNKQDRAKNVKFDEAYIRKLVNYVRHFHASNKPTLAQAASAKTQ